MERCTKLYGWLLELARSSRPCPTNYEIARKVGMGRQAFQPADRLQWGPQGPRWKKPEAGAVLIAALEQAGLISCERGRNWRRITILKTGQVLEPRVDPGYREKRKRPDRYTIIDPEFDAA